MEPDDDQDSKLRLSFPLRDVIDALTRLETAASLAGSALQRGSRVAPSDEWPEVVLEDILDAECLGEE